MNDNPAPQAIPDPAVGLQFQSAPVAPAAGGTAAFNTGELEQGIQPNRWGKFAADAKAVSMQSLFGFIPGYGGTVPQAVSDFYGEQSSKLSPEEANKRSPGLPTPFTEPTAPEVVDAMYGNYLKRKHLQDWAARGTEDLGRGAGILIGAGVGAAAGAIGGLPGMVGGAVAGGIAGGYAGAPASLGALDPANLLLNAATMGLGSRFTQGAGTMARIFAENAAINAATGVPSYLLAQKEHMGVTLEDAGKEFAASTILGTVIGKAMHVGFSHFANEPVAEKMQKLKEAISNHENGAPVDLTNSVANTGSKLAGATKIGAPQNEYQFVPVDHPSERTYYAGSHPDTGESIQMDAYGPGVYSDDNGMRANNVGERVAEVSAPKDTTFLDLSEPLDGKTHEEFVKAVEKDMGGKRSELDLPDGSSIKDALDVVSERVQSGTLPESTLTQIQDVAKSMGFDGYKYVSNEGGSNSNRMVMFDQGKVQFGEEFQSNPDFTPSRTPEEKNATLEASAHPDKASVNSQIDPDQVERQKTAKQIDPKVELDPVMKEQEAQAQALLKEIAAGDPDLAKELESLSAEKKQDLIENSVMKKFANCVVESIT